MLRRYGHMGERRCLAGSLLTDKAECLICGAKSFQPCELFDYNNNELKCGMTVYFRDAYIAALAAARLKRGEG